MCQCAQCNIDDSGSSGMPLPVPSMPSSTDIFADEKRRRRRRGEKRERANGKWQLYGDVCCVRACCSVILPLSSRHIDISPKAARYRFWVSVRSRAPIKNVKSNHFIISIQFYFSLSRALRTSMRSIINGVDQSRLLRPRRHTKHNHTSVARSHKQW